LKLPCAGRRTWSGGSVINRGTYGDYWSSSPYNAYAYFLNFQSSSVIPQNLGGSRAYGFSVRCFKN
jgi:uncharacterized protein (TIGR02145 family)